MDELLTVEDVVDVLSPCSFYIDHQPPHHLVKKAGAEHLHRRMKTAGFKVQPLVGDTDGGWNMSWYRQSFHDPTFSNQATEEILNGGLEGLNFDYEAHQPGTRNDSIAFARMVSGVQSGSRSKCTIDFPCDGDTCDPATLAKYGIEVWKLMDMGTYGGGNISTWGSYLHQSIAAVGDVKRYGMGVCPSCSKGLTEAQVYERLRLAEAAGVQEIDVWCNVDSGDPDAAMWWKALRLWKAGKLPPSPGPAPGGVKCNPHANPPETCPGGQACPACGQSECACPKSEAGVVEV